MTATKITKYSSLDKLWDAASEDTLTETLEELRAASAEDYGDPDFLANECRDVALKAISEFDRRRSRLNIKRLAKPTA